MRYLPLLVLTLLLSSSLHAQEYFTGYQGDLPEPRLDMSTEERQAYLDSAQADSLVIFDSGFSTGFKLKKEAGWFLYIDGRQINTGAFDYLGPFGEHFYEYARAERKGKWGFINYKGEGHMRYDALKFIDQGYGQEPIVLAKSWGHWGQIVPGYPLPVLPFIYDRPGDVPAILEPGYYLETFDELRELVPVDLILPDPNNGDGIYKVRDKNSKQWGMFQFISSGIDTLVPALYDSLEFYAFNGVLTPVWLDGKVGFYGFSERDQLLACAYDDFKVVKYRRSIHSPAYIHLLVKKEDHWGYVDFPSGEPLSGFTESHPDSVPLPSRESSYYDY